MSLDVYTTQLTKSYGWGDITYYLQNLSHEEISDKHRKKTDEIINPSNLNGPEIDSVYTTMKKALRY